MDIRHLFAKPNPVIARRGVHLDLKGLPPKPARFVELLGVFAAARYNVVLVEWEDAFPWTVDERFRSPTCYSPADIARFTETAAALGLELIPLVQCLGHMETPLSMAGYEHLRELPDHPASLNPLAEGAGALVQRMVDDVLERMPNVAHLHLGGDESWTFGKSEQTRAYIEAHGKGALYLHHVGPILERLNARGVRPILWHDMMIEWDSAALSALAARSDLMVWGYQGHPDTTQRHFKSRYIERFAAHGLTLWGATAYKGAEGYDADVPDHAVHSENALAWSEVAQRHGMVGVVATAWSRYAVDTLQCNPIDSSLDSLLNVAVILHDGEAPTGGVEACVRALVDVGEHERFNACRGAMQRLAELRRAGWSQVQRARQAAVLGRLDQRRTSARNPNAGLRPLTELTATVEKAGGIAEEVRRCFEGLVDRVWIEEYLATRLDPLREELAELQSMNLTP
jgi:predicted Fe-S protein YdhL (DUF1289 family)